MLVAADLAETAFTDSVISSHVSYVSTSYLIKFNLPAFVRNAIETWHLSLSRQMSQPVVLVMVVSNLDHWIQRLGNWNISMWKNTCKQNLNRGSHAI